MRAAVWFIITNKHDCAVVVETKAITGTRNEIQQRKPI